MPYILNQGRIGLIASKLTACLQWTHKPLTQNILMKSDPLTLEWHYKLSDSNQDSVTIFVNQSHRMPDNRTVNTVILHNTTNNNNQDMKRVSPSNTTLRADIWYMANTVGISFPEVTFEHSGELSLVVTTGGGMCVDTLQIQVYSSK